MRSPSLGTRFFANEYYPALARILFKLAVEVQKETGVHIAFINLSGGVGIPYAKPWQEPNDIMAIGEGVHCAFDEVLVPGRHGRRFHLHRRWAALSSAPTARSLQSASTTSTPYKEYAGSMPARQTSCVRSMYGAYHHITVLGKGRMRCMTAPTM
ncbi:MAG: hypothetical protein ACLR4Z_17640 [Butyricicoccaceae bacterium]